MHQQCSVGETLSHRCLFLGRSPSFARIGEIFPGIIATQDALATVPGLQMRVMRHASAAPTLASGANIAAFNVGNALGAWVGGLTLAAGLGYTSPLWAGAAVTLVGVVVMAVAMVAPGGERTTYNDRFRLPRGLRRPGSRPLQNRHHRAMAHPGPHYPRRPCRT